MSRSWFTCCGRRASRACRRAISTAWGGWNCSPPALETFERKIRDQLARSLSDGGFDPAHDITGITVNRWPHGYAYEYNSLWDTFWRDGTTPPCVAARKRFGRIAIANADADAYAYTDCAMDQAYRAVQELAGSMTS